MMEWIPTFNMVLIAMILVFTWIYSGKKFNFETRGDVLRALMRNSETTLYACVAADMSGKIIDVTDGVQALLGWRPIELVGKPVEMLVPPNMRAQHEAGFESLRRTGHLMESRQQDNTVSAVSGFALCKLGTTVPVLVTLHLIGGNVVAVIYLRRENLVIGK